MQYKILNCSVFINFLAPIFRYGEIDIFPSNDESQTADLTFSIHPLFVSARHGILYLSPDLALPARHLFLSQTDPRCVMASGDPLWRRFEIYCGEGAESAISELVLTGLYSYLSLQGALLLHASAIAYQGRSLVFTAPSGTGKTTQAELWMRHRGAEILNGDKVFFKREEDAIHAWGSPWTGSSPYGLNRSAPLRAVIILKQAKSNSIRRLDTLEAMAEFIPNVFFPSWDERCEQAALDFLDQVMSETAFYLLSCRPDEEAVAITEETVFGGEMGGMV